MTAPKQNEESLGRHPTLGSLLHQRRRALGLSFGRLSALAGFSVGVLHKLEHDQGGEISPEVLQRLADALDLPTADLYAAAGFELPTELPTFSPYLRAKYHGLPVEAQAELQRSFERIADKYGYDPAGPKPGEDEN